MFLPLACQRLIPLKQQNALVLYLIFKGRRTQRIIPEIHGATNTSIDFAQTISPAGLHFANSILRP